MLALAICMVWILTAAKAQLIDCPFDESEIFSNLEEEPIPETRFELYTRKNAYVYQDLSDKTSILRSNYDPQKGTVLCIHGYTLDPSSLYTLKSAYLQKLDSNFIMVNWKIAASELNLLKAARNVPIVAKFIANKLEELKNITGCQFRNVHIIGWSLGGQLAGFVGKYVSSEKIGRITALDPCGVCFEEFSTAHKLHISDAGFVDVIVTNRGPVVVNEPTGHVMFLPDGGEESRGCDHIIDGQLWSSIIPLQICSHMRAMELFTESLKLRSNCLHVGYACPSYDMFENGECYHCGIDQRNCLIMGIDADTYANRTTKKTKVFFLDTTFTGDFCLLQYHVEVVIANTTDSRTEVGILYLVVNSGMSDEVEFMLKPSANRIPRPEYLIPGGKYTYLVLSHKNIQFDTVKTVGFFWVSYLNDESSRLYISCVTILPMNDRNYLHGNTIFATAGEEGILPEVMTPLQLTQSC